jgi:hypothetical protein
VYYVKGLVIGARARTNKHTHLHAWVHTRAQILTSPFNTSSEQCLGNHLQATSEKRVSTCNENTAPGGKGEGDCAVHDQVHFASTIAPLEQDLSFSGQRKGGDCRGIQNDGGVGGWGVQTGLRRGTAPCYNKKSERDSTWSAQQKK